MYNKGNYLLMFSYHQYEI